MQREKGKVVELVLGILGKIWDNFNSAEGKLIVGALIDLFLYVGIYVQAKSKDWQGALRTAGIALASSAVFSFLATLHPGAPGFFTCFKMLGISSIIVFAIVVLFAAFSTLAGGGDSQPGTSSTSGQRIVDEQGLPIEVHQVGAHYEDDYGNHYQLYGNVAVPDYQQMRTADGDYVRVRKQGSVYCDDNGNTWRLNGSGWLER